MVGSLSGRQITIIGGDERELVLMAELSKLNCRINALGYDKIPQLPNSATHGNKRESLTEADVIIFPISGVGVDGRVNSMFSTKPIFIKPLDFDFVRPETLILSGTSNHYLKNEAERCGFRIIETASLDSFAILNSIPTAEGAIEIAMQEIDTTVHGSQILIFGFGRIGKSLGRMLHALGARVSVTCAKNADLARAVEMGIQVLDYQKIEAELNRMNILFNTVPAMVLTKNLLGHLNPHTIIIDLASGTGGTDFDAASSMGIKTVHALGLPGKVAPITAGRILGQVYGKLLSEELTFNNKGEMAQ